MNKSKLPMTPKARKKVTKEIRKAVETPIITQNTTKKAPVKSSPKVVAKKTVKTSKRTAPGLVKKGTAPANAHVEGKRWINSKRKQAKESNLLITKKLSKKKR